MEFIASPPPRGGKGVPRPGSGRPGIPRPNVKQTPTERQPNRGLGVDATEFTCSACREKLPIDQAHTVAVKGKPRRRTGRCIPCALAQQREANAKQAVKWRGPDYVLPFIKDRESPVVDGARSCLVCEEVKPLASFYEDHTVTSGYQAVCRVCRGVERKARYEAMSPEQRELYMDQTWVKWVWRTYRLTVEDFERMAASQEWACAICKKVPDSRLCVDHDHSCCPGKRSCGTCLRQLLCHYCNTVVGFLETAGTSGASIDAYLAAHSGATSTPVRVVEHT